MSTTFNPRAFARLSAAVVFLGLLAFGSAKPVLGQVPGTPIPVGVPGFILEFDEAGHGRLIDPATGTAHDDPGVPLVGGGLAYALPVPVAAGDVIVINPLDITPSNPSGFSDLLRFPGGPTLLYFSLLDESETNPDPADVAGLGFPDTPFSVFESGPEGHNSFVWLVAPGTPSNTVYNGISDVPEPSAFALGAVGLAALALIRRNRGGRAGAKLR